MMTSTSYGLTVPEGKKEERSMVNGEVVKFKYPEVFTDHYRYRQVVDTHSSLRHDGSNKSHFGLQSKQGTNWRPIRAFAFFVVCTEVNAYLAMKDLLKTDDKFMDF